MKVIINRCFGGFSISNLALKKYCELKGKTAYFYTEESFRGKYTLISCEEPSMFAYCCTKPIKDGESPFDNDFVSSSDFERDDEILIKVVEELGKKANGMCADLRIVEIPDGIKYEISEYDGLERVEELHRSWN